MSFKRESQIIGEKVEQHSMVYDADDKDLIISFEEPKLEEEISFFEIDHDELMDSHDSKQMQFRLPGAVDYVEEPEIEKPKEEEEEGDWENSRNVKYFMEYVVNKYPNGIPKHDGKTTLGCERAIAFLTNLNKEISEALRKDRDDILDIATLERIRVNIMQDIMNLKEHIKKLNKKRKNAEEETTQIVKEAKSGAFQVVISAFERAICGMIINSVVSAGKDLEQVYEALKKKYEFTEREELAIIQILMDMGYPIFKDRGSIGNSDLTKDGEGIDFMKNYFA